MGAVRTLGWVMLAGAGAAGCSGAGAPIEPAHVMASAQARSSQRQGLEPAAQLPEGRAPQRQGFRKRVEALAVAYGDLVTIASSAGGPQVAIAVTFKRGDGKESARCPVVIYEARGGRVIEAASSEVLLSCTLETSASQAGKKIDVDVDRAGASVRQQSAKSNAQFKLARDGSGTWRVVDAEFNTPQYDPDSDAMRVLTERAVYQAGEYGPAVEDYSYEKLKQDLVEGYVD